MNYLILTIVSIQLLFIGWIVPQAYQAADSFDFEEYVNTMIREQAAEVKDDFTTEVFEVSAYTSNPSETDDTPCISASGVNLCKNTISDIHRLGIIEDRISVDGIIACPVKYDFGTLFLIENEKYICLDLMNVRYRDGNYLDIYMGNDINAAREFGRQHLEVKVYE